MPTTALTKKNTSFVWTVACQTALDTIKHVITNSPVLIYPNPSREYHLFTDASKHTWSGVLTQQRSNSEINGDKEHTYHQITYQTSTFWLHNLNSQQLWRNAMQLWCCFKNGILPTRHRSHLKVWSWPSWKLIKNQTKNTLTQNWTLEIFSITPYIMFKHIKVRKISWLTASLNYKGQAYMKGAHRRKMIEIVTQY